MKNKQVFPQEIIVILNWFLVNFTFDPPLAFSLSITR